MEDHRETDDLVQRTLFESSAAVETTTAIDRPNRAQIENEKPDFHSAGPVIITSPAAYHPATWILLSMVFAPMLISALSVQADSNLAPSEKRQAHMVLRAATLGVVVVFLLVLPRSFQIESDASLRVVTFVPGVSYRFAGVTAAGAMSPGLLLGGAGGGTDPVRGWWRPHLKFTTDWTRRVVIRRKPGKWDVVISSQDPAGFIAAVDKVTRS